MKFSRQHVAVAVIVDGEDRVLLSKRPIESHQGGLWEFPGGKVESEETVQAALIREVHEELGVVVTQFRPLIRIPFDYKDRGVLLDVWYVYSFSGNPSGLEGQEIRWVHRSQLENYNFPAANLPILSALNLPDKYLITPDPGQTEKDWKTFLSQLKKSISAGHKLVQFRAKSLCREKFIELAREVITTCHRDNCRVLLNSDVEIASRIKADGIHISSSVLLQQHERVLESDMLLAASCHNLDELWHANHIRCNFAVLSPILKTASHPTATPLGWGKFSHYSDESPIPVYALGGMSQDCIQEAWSHGAQGVSGISEFWSR